MAVCSEDVKKKVLDLVNATPGAEIVEGSEDRIRFRGKAPQRTFEVVCEDGGGFRVKETTGFQTAGRNGQPTPYGERDVIDESRMLGQVRTWLNQLRAA
jgi:hypothetical protein